MHATELHDYIGTLPATLLPVLIGGDMNTPVRWTQSLGEAPLPTGPESKEECMFGVLQAQEFCMTAPPCEQWLTPTSRPRCVEARGRQIDMVGTCGNQAMSVCTSCHSRELAPVPGHQ